MKQGLTLHSFPVYLVRISRKWPFLGVSMRVRQSKSARKCPSAEIGKAKMGKKAREIWRNACFLSGNYQEVSGF